MSLEEKEILAYIYAAKDMCHDIVPTTGTDVSIIAWLCADCDVETAEE